MFKNLTYKKKATYLMVMLIIGCLVVYSFAIKNTIEERKTCNELNKQLESLQYAPYQIADYEKKLNLLEQSAGASSADSSYFQESLLSLVSKYCSQNSLILSEFPQPHRFEQNNIVIETYPITIKGGFIKMLKLLHYTEIHRQYGRISSVKFIKKKDSKSEQFFLFMTMYIQYIKKIEK